jgi:NAD(P)H-dependent FMN reductase
MPVLQVIIASTRPGRVGAPVGHWFVERAREHGGFEVELVDLAEVNLPFFDEPRRPRFGDYQHEHTKRWSRLVSRADAFVIVTPEYNYGFSAVLKNALDFLNREWADKPVGFVSYGGVSAGTRAVQMLKQVVAGLRMIPVTDAVAIPFVTQVIVDGEVKANEVMLAAATTMLDELLRMTTAMQLVRAMRL